MTMNHHHQPRPKLGNLSRRRLAQGYSFGDLLVDLPLGKDINTSSFAVDLSTIQSQCFHRIYRFWLTKYIQIRNISRRKWLILFVVLVNFSILVVVDRMTTRTQSTSKWARMMYEDSGAKSASLRGSAGNRQPSSGTISDLHIAFVGDSVTRYMYLDLVYFLRHNKWVQDNDSPNILNAKQFPSWNDHYNASTLALAPNEECDCFRLNPKNSSHIDKEETIENRYYADPERNNYATFIEVFGGYQAHGHLLPEEAYVQHRHAMDFDRLQTDPFVWRHDWPGLIRNYLNEMNPKPDYLVFNEGLWIEHELGDEDVRQSIKDALDDSGIIGIYKTTTLPNINSGLAKRSAGVVFNRHDDAMCELIGNYLDFSWTKDLGDEHYWDGVHFKPHVNRGMNMELLDMLQKLKQGPVVTPAPLKATQ
ncbi:expressed unknown protein [Seminavis robusta]|uniref:Uncharacterized protein n=1 Tax=Seminavis robusta TaxID=568900 RepID=A0A9N8HCE9_9STRA|nr:expressed unknown protein [Seminavis robusta]|eukprot:Sro316_g115580.1 n/a (420) ;mRNA; f:63767-65026